MIREIIHDTFTLRIKSNDAAADDAQVAKDLAEMLLSGQVYEDSREALQRVWCTDNSARN